MVRNSNFVRALKIYCKGRRSLKKRMGRTRYFELLNRAKSIFDPVYTIEEASYILNGY